MRKTDMAGLELTPPPFSSIRRGLVNKMDGYNYYYYYYYYYYY